MTLEMTAGKGFDVAPWMDRLGGYIERNPARWIKLGSLETHLVESALADVRVDRPVYVTGLPRSGTTILLEILARHPEVATHRYRDFPMLFTPYAWNRWLELVPRRQEAPAERSHGDGIAVTSESPEAFEEPLWMAFFPELHDANENAVLDRGTQHPLFERFYRDHIRKLLAVRGRRRYVAKGNYNVTRIGYLANLFPDARFVIPVRDPVWHIASLMKQHRLFLDGQRDNPAARRHLRRVGHFEFGEDRRPIRIDDGATTAEIIELWQAGEEVRGWARYWAQLHRYIADLMEREPRSAIRIVRYEDLCASPQAILRELLAHCALPAREPFLADAAGGLHPPTYYRPRFSAGDLAIIAEETAEAADRFGYGGDRSPALRQSAE
jgi:hypothetical protein